MYTTVVKTDRLFGKSREKIDFCFKVHFFFYRFMPNCVHECLYGKVEPDNKADNSSQTSFKYMVSHFEELTARAKFELSVRNFATIGIRLSNFKEEQLVRNE